MKIGLDAWPGVENLMRSRPLLWSSLLIVPLLLFAAFFAVDLELLPALQARDQAAPADKYVPPKGYVCYRARMPVQVDGRLDKPVWQDAPWTDAFVDIEGDARPKPRFRTRAKMLWDNDYFYIGAELEEPHVCATLTNHDSVIFQDNDFEVFINADGDNHDYAEFEINALNTGWDLLLTRPYKDGGRAITSWEIPGLKTAVHIDGTLNDPSDRDRGWTVEIAFPWKVFQELTSRAVPPRDGDQWRVNFSRVEWQFDVVDGKYRKVKEKREDNWVWSPQGAINMHRPETWGYVQFSTAKTGDPKFEPDAAGPVKHLLHRIYYAQCRYRAQHGTFANNLKELGILPGDVVLTRPVKVETTESGFEATAELTAAGKLQRWHIREDSRIWMK
jgi:hypothetical protein